MKNLDLANLPKVGDKYVFNHRGAGFVTTIGEARIRYGVLDVYITPVGGFGGFWVRYDSPVTATPELAQVA